MGFGFHAKVLFVNLIVQGVQGFRCLIGIVQGREGGEGVGGLIGIVQGQDG